MSGATRTVYAVALLSDKAVIAEAFGALDGAKDAYKAAIHCAKLDDLDVKQFCFEFPAVACAASVQAEAERLALQVNTPLLRIRPGKRNTDGTRAPSGIRFPGSRLGLETKWVIAAADGAGVTALAFDDPEAALGRYSADLRLEALADKQISLFTIETPASFIDLAVGQAAEDAAQAHDYQPLRWRPSHSGRGFPHKNPATDPPFGHGPTPT